MCTTLTLPWLISQIVQLLAKLSRQTWVFCSLNRKGDSAVGKMLLLLLHIPWTEHKTNDVVARWNTALDPLESLFHEVIRAISLTAKQNAS